MHFTTDNDLRIVEIPDETKKRLFPNTKEVGFFDEYIKHESISDFFQAMEQVFIGEISEITLHLTTLNKPIQIRCEPHIKNKQQIERITFLLL